MADAKQNPQNYNPMLAIDLQKFNNSEEFRAYVTKWDNAVWNDVVVSIAIGWLLILMSDIAMVCISILRYIATKARFINLKAPSELDISKSPSARLRCKCSVTPPK